MGFETLNDIKSKEPEIFVWRFPMGFETLLGEWIYFVFPSLKIPYGIWNCNDQGAKIFFFRPFEDSLWDLKLQHFAIAYFVRYGLKIPYGIWN